MKRWLGVLGLLGLATSCVSERACEDYSDYICECRAEEYDCNRVRLENSDPDAEQLADCQVEHDRLLEEDASAGNECSAEGS
ncbi:MAG TPA: hypothetical protein QGF58_14545 [Myxococcota bacterium]|nr:hypothetical protein [Myxococcota bacterium]